jgi:hypothetical protein
MFKTTRDRLVLPKYWNKEKYFRIFGKYLTRAQETFVRENWFSLDGLEIEATRERTTVTIYEIKTGTDYQQNMRFKPKMTASTAQLYAEAQRRGFLVRFAVVRFYTDWHFGVEIKDYDPAHYCVDAPKRYDKRPGGFGSGGAVPIG